MKILQKAIDIVSNNIGGIGSAISGISSIAGNLLSNQGARDAQREANELTRQLYYADREYNTPKNQVARLKEAGLNPNLIYGGGGVIAGNTSKGAPKMESIGGYDIDFASAINAAASFMNMKKVAKETKNTEKEGDLLDEKITSQKIQNEIAEHDASIITNSPVVSTDRGTVPMVARTLSNVGSKLIDDVKSKGNKSDFVKGAKNVLGKPLTNTQTNAKLSDRSTPWFMRSYGRPWFMKY